MRIIFSISPRGCVPSQPAEKAKERPGWKPSWERAKILQKKPIKEPEKSSFLPCIVREKPHPIFFTKKSLLSNL